MRPRRTKCSALANSAVKAKDVGAAHVPHRSLRAGGFLGALLTELLHDVAIVGFREDRLKVVRRHVDVDAEIVEGTGREAEFVGDAYRRILLA